MMYGWWDGASVPWYGMIFGPFMMIAFIVLTVVIIAWILRQLNFWPGYVSANASALDILRDRFARGEINRAEFEERKQTLSST